MLSIIYILIFLTGIAFLILSLLYDKLIPPIIAMILFFFLAYSSLNIEINYCNTVTIAQNLTNANYTTFESDMLCENDIIRDIPLSSLNGGLALVSLVQLILVSLTNRNIYRWGGKR